jgi:hypothetical protein
MAITYAIAPDQRRIRVYASGIIRAEDLHKFLDDLLEDPGLGPGLRALYDARFAEPDITILQLAEVATKVARVVARGVERIAIVGESTNTIRVSKTFATLARAVGIDVEVFTDLEEADAWLDEPREDVADGGSLLRPKE